MNEKFNKMFPAKKENDGFVSFGESFKVYRPTEHELLFNHKYTAFDVLVNYAFGGDKKAALEYLKTL